MTLPRDASLRLQCAPHDVYGCAARVKPSSFATSSAVTPLAGFLQ